MSGIWGKNIRYSIFGESHGAGIGITIDGLPAGIALDLDFIGSELERRRPGKSELATARRESDSFEIMSGFFKGRTTGSPLCIIIRNNDQRSGDYEQQHTIMRPGHADYTANTRYSGFNDYRGGGHFSGRLTAPIVFAGGIAKQLLAQRDIIIGSHISSIGNIYDQPFDSLHTDGELLRKLSSLDFPVLAEAKGDEMIRLILSAKSEGDSVGGIIETAAVNLPAGIGSPFFDSVESSIAHLVYSIPGVKGIEFGRGFELAGLRGSQANDGMYYENDELHFYSNNNGGILGGITDGAPLIFRTAIKPTPSIGKVQRTIDLEKRSNAELALVGRHDPCIVPRALPAVEAAAAMAILELLSDLENGY